MTENANTAVAANLREGRGVDFDQNLEPGEFLELTICHELQAMSGHANHTVIPLPLFRVWTHSSG